MKHNLLIFTLLLVTSYTFSQSNPAFIDTLFYGKNGIKNIHSDLGVSIGILKNGKSNFYNLGNIDHSSNQKIDKNTVFEIGSNTKLFTALLLALKIEENKIKKTAFIDSYLPKKVKLHSNLKNKVFMTDLASYSSGLPTLHGDERDSLLSVQDSIQPYKLVDKKYLYNILKNTTELVNYGKYEYSNFNYGLLGLILENIEHKKYTELLEKEIFKPLDLKNTYTDVVNTNNKAVGYSEDNLKVDYLELDALKSAGIIKSCSSDLLKFLEFQLNPQNDLIGKATLLTQDIFLTDKEAEIQAGLGWHILSENNNPYYVMQGDTLGASSLLYFDKESNVGIVILTNQSNHNLTGIVLDYLMKKIKIEA